MKYDNFSHLTQAQQLAVVLGAAYEASVDGEWIPGNRCIACSRTVFRIAPKHGHLIAEAEGILSRRADTIQED